MKQKIKDFFYETRLLVQSVPSFIFAAFILSLFAMNLLANKSIGLGVDWLALDTGIIVSWVAFLCMDVLTKHFGPKAATKLSIIAICVNLFACLILYLASIIPGVWGAYYDYGELDVINSALNGTFGGTWYVLMGSTIAFIGSAIVNNFANWGIGKAFKRNPDGFGAFILRSYASTAIGQFVDNIVFALIVSHFFFGWTIIQCLTCAATGMIVELIVEAVFSPLGYKVCDAMRKNDVGKKYFDYIAVKENK